MVQVPHVSLTFGSGTRPMICASQITGILYTYNSKYELLPRPFRLSLPTSAPEPVSLISKCRGQKRWPRRTALRAGKASPQPICLDLSAPELPEVSGKRHPCLTAAIVRHAARKRWVTTYKPTSPSIASRVTLSDSWAGRQEAVRHVHPVPAICDRMILVRGTMSLPRWLP